MINESEKIFENIKNVKRLLTESVTEDVLIKAIQNHEWIRIYYDAGKGDGKDETGYRVIRPYVLGKYAVNGLPVLRAWQDNAANSRDFKNRNKDSKRSLYHDYWVDSEGEKPGWRFLYVEKIKSAYPIGKKFHDSNGLVMIPPGYHEGDDKDMSSVDYYVSTKNMPDFKYQYDKDMKVDVVTPNDNIAKWDSIRRGNKNSRKITPEEVSNLRRYLSRVIKKSSANYVVVINDAKEFQLITVNEMKKNNIPDMAVVGSLPYLYDTMVKGSAPDGDKFYKDIKNKIVSDIRLDSKKYDKNISETEKTSIPHKKMTFFK